MLPLLALLLGGGAAAAGGAGAAGAAGAGGLGALAGGLGAAGAAVPATMATGATAAIPAGGGFGAAGMIPAASMGISNITGAGAGAAGGGFGQFMSGLGQRFGIGGSPGGSPGTSGWDTFFKGSASTPDRANQLNSWQSGATMGGDQSMGLQMPNYVRKGAGEFAGPSATQLDAQAQQYIAQLLSGLRRR